MRRTPPSRHEQSSYAFRGSGWSENRPGSLRWLAILNVRGILTRRTALGRANAPCGCSSVVERHVANVNVGRSNRLTRFPTLAWMPGLSPVIPGE